MKYSPSNPNDLKTGAFNIWLTYYFKKEDLHQRMKSLLDHVHRIKDIAPPERLSYRELKKHPKTWIKATRESFLLSSSLLSKQFGANRTWLSDLEKAESNGTITLNNLKKAAEALNCELIYGFVSKDGLTPAEKVWETLYPYACHTRFVTKATPTQKMYGIATSARKLMEDLSFREKQGWSKRGRITEGGIFREISRLESKQFQELENLSRNQHQNTKLKSSIERV